MAEQTGARSAVAVFFIRQSAEISPPTNPARMLMADISRVRRVHSARELRV